MSNPADIHPIAQELWDMAKFIMPPTYRGSHDPYPAGISDDHRASLRMTVDGAIGVINQVAGATYYDALRREEPTP